MPDIVFTCTCKCAFQRWKRDDEAWEHACPLCGEVATDIIGMEPMAWKRPTLRLPGDQYDYISPIDGKHIQSKHAHRDHMKRHGVVELGNEHAAATKQPTPNDPRPMIREEMRNTVERMKSDGRWR